LAKICQIRQTFPSSKFLDIQYTCELQAEEYTQEQLGEMIAKYNVVSPVNKNEVTSPQPFNLMFGTAIGPDHGVPA